MFAVVFGIGGLNGFLLETLVVGLPGQPTVGFRQFAGYIDVDVKVSRSLFYYFVEAEKDPEHKPLTLWLNGGPGCSSLGGGAFTELGPFFLTGDGRDLQRNPKLWNKASNLLFVESPAGVGWSYSNTTSDYNAGDTSTSVIHYFRPNFYSLLSQSRLYSVFIAANDMYLFMMKWYEKFPALKFKDLFLTGESYAGRVLLFTLFAVYGDLT